MVPHVESQRREGRLYYGWVVVAAGFMIWSTAFAIQYSFGIFFSPLQEAFGWSRSTTSWAMTAFLLVYALCMVPAGWLFDRTSPRLLFSAAAVLIGASLALSSRISEAWQLYLIYGLPLAAGMSVCAPAVGAMTTRWFTRKRGIALGIVSAGVGFGTLVGAPVSYYLLAAHGWRTSFVVLGAAAGAILLVCALFTRRAPSPENSADSPGAAPAAARGMALRRVLKSRAMLLILAAQIFALFTQRMVMVHIVPHAIDSGISYSAAALIIGTIGAFSILGRLGMGFAQDKIGPRAALIICLAVQGVAMLALPFAGTDALLLLFAAAFGFTYGGDIPQIPALVAQQFGLAIVGVTYAMAVAVGNLGGAVGPIVAGYAFDRTGSYAGVFIGAGVSLFIGAYCIWKLRPGR